jgi:hypothetical protein
LNGLAVVWEFGGMRVVSLSDHPGEQLRRSRQQGRKDQRRVQAELVRLESVRDQARAGRRWLAWFRAARAVRRAKRQAVASARPLSDNEARLAAGVRGEQVVATELGRSLGDEWVLFRGYHNRRGEIDHILLGPDGLAAIEVKYVNGTFHCDGDRWRVVKFDNYGNQVEEYDLVAGGNRSPSTQLNEPADELESFLQRRGENVDLLRVVQLTHPKAQIGTCRRATVSIFTKTSQITALMKKVPQPLDAARRARIEELIVKDHRFNATRRSTSSARTTRTARSASP